MVTIYIKYFFDLHNLTYYKESVIIRTNLNGGLIRDNVYKGVLYMDNINNLTKEEYDYIENIRKIPKLSKNDRISLVLKAKDNDEVAREKLILSHLYLIIPIAIRYSNDYNISFSEAFSIGTIGLINSIENFDLTYGVNFYNYANWYIKQNINRYVRTSLNHISIPENKKIIVRDIKIFYEDYIEKYDKEPTIDEISKHFNIDSDKAVALLRLIINPTSLENTDITDYFFEEEILDKVYLEEIIDIISKIPNIRSRDIRIVYERYGIIDGKQKTFEEVSKIFNLTRARVKQIELETFSKIRRYILTYGINEAKAKQNSRNKK